MQKHNEKECFVKKGIKRGAGWCEASVLGICVSLWSGGGERKVAFDGFAPLRQKSVSHFYFAAKSGGTAENFSSLWHMSRGLFILQKILIK